MEKVDFNPGRRLSVGEKNEIFIINFYQLYMFHYFEVKS